MGFITVNKMKRVSIVLKFNELLIKMIHSIFEKI